MFKLIVRPKRGKRYSVDAGSLESAMVLVPYYLGRIIKMNFGATSSERFVFIGEHGNAMIRKG